METKGSPTTKDVDAFLRFIKRELISIRRAVKVGPISYALSLACELSQDADTWRISMADGSSFSMYSVEGSGPTLTAALKNYRENEG